MTDPLFSAWPLGAWPLSLWLYLGFLAALGLERLFELSLSRRHAAWAFSVGGIEHGQRHFTFMKLLHLAFFAGCVAETLLLRRPFTAALGFPMLALALATQALRYWAISSLGRYWNVRVIVVPGAPAITSGPFRYLRHPNYLAVVLEGIAVPLIHGAWLTALVFTLLDAALLVVRIRCEEAALSQHCDYQARLGGRARFVPASAREVDAR